VQSTKQEQIVGYFIEEAREHLDTLERGLLDLQQTVNDPEYINELFRAAHSVKGGAAMLGFESIHKTAHHLEDCLKLLKENPVQVNQQIETFFLAGLDALKELTDLMEGPFGFQEEAAQQVRQRVEPTFTQLEAYLKQLISGGSAPAPAPQLALPANFAPQINDCLRQMLPLFKQPASAAGRQQLAAVCDQMIHLAPTVGTWRSLIQMAQRAISDPRNAYSTLAPVVIKDIKTASEYLLAQQSEPIQASANLQKLAESANGVDLQPQRITIPMEPQAAARILIECFSKDQLREIAKALVSVLKA
jgi:chemotaxis protein histidine kinase CheA